MSKAVYQPFKFINHVKFDQTVIYMYLLVMLDGVLTSIWSPRLISRLRLLELWANLIFEASVPTIILFSVFCKNIDNLCKWLTFWPKDLRQRKILYVNKSAYKIWLWWRPLGWNVRHLQKSSTSLPNTRKRIIMGMLVSNIRLTRRSKVLKLRNFPRWLWCLCNFLHHLTL